MAFPFAFLLTVALLLASSQGQRQGTIGPVGDLVVSNGNVNPDGFERLGALANSQIDGALITGNKVSLSSAHPQRRLPMLCSGRYFPDQCRQPARQ